MESLQKQINEISRTIFTDSYSMSVGELISMYTSKEIDIHPEFQRNYRWEIDSKSKLIESLLLGIPIPPIFVFQKDNGIWDVIDGQQRLSTIFEFAGVYRNEKDETQPPLKLKKGKYLSALEGIIWENEDDTVYQLSIEYRIIIKRAKIDIKILKSNSNENVKYDLFQRLNTGGQQLAPQEVRNCLIIMENAAFYDRLLQIRKNLDFKSCLPLSERAIKEQEDIEHIVRFLVARNCEIRNMPNSLHDYFDESIIELLRDPNFDIDNEVYIFNKVFALLNNILGEDVFKKYYIEQNKFKGAATISAFEAIVPAISKNIEFFEKIDIEKLKNRIKEMHSMNDFISNYRKNSIDRYSSLIIFGNKHFDIGDIERWQ